MKKFLFSIGLFLMSLSATAQRDCGLWLNEVPLVADTAAGKLYVTLEQGISHYLSATLRWDTARYTGAQINDQTLSNATRGNLHVNDWTHDAVTLTLTDTDSVNHPWQLVFSNLPFIVLDCPIDSMMRFYSVTKGTEGHTRKFGGHISVIDARCRTKLSDSEVGGMARFDSRMRTRLRGATSGSAPKSSLNIELVNDSGSYDVHLLGYRKDDDWILSAEWTDYSRMRNRVLMDLWNSVEDLPYKKDNRYQCNGTQGEFVEVFVNGGYYGLYTFTDKIDRKKLNLKKTKEATASSAEVKRGLLWKANWECGETYLNSYDALPANDTLFWPYISSKSSFGWEQKYPDDNSSQAFFNPICDLIDFLDSSAFKTHWTDHLYEQNVIDFILFVQAFQLLDNQKKNYYLSMRNHDKEQKYLFTLWDLDGSLGQMAGGDTVPLDPKQMAWGEKLGYHHLIHLFKTERSRPAGFATKMNDRWQYLSTHQLSPQNVRAVMEHYGNLFVESGAWEREKARWSSRYKRVVKIADTPASQIEFMTNWLDTNYAIFNEKMASASWTHEPYDETRYLRNNMPPALYVVGQDISSSHEDNTVILPGTVQQELVSDIDRVEFSESTMSVVRENDTHAYPVADIKEVKTDYVALYTTPAFIPDSLKPYFAFDTRHAPVWEITPTVDTAFQVLRTVYVRFDGQEASVYGNLDSITATVNGDSVAFSTTLEGVAYLVSGRSETGKITVNCEHPCKLAAAEPGALLSAFYANCPITVNTPYALNFFSDQFDAKCLQSTEDVIIEDGHLYFLMTSEGTLTDASFNDNPTLGARAVMANNIYINGGQVSIKTLGHNGAVGLAAARKLFIRGGRNLIATYDDPVKTGSSATVSGGFTFTSSLTNDGLDSKGDLTMDGGFICSCGPEGAEAAFDVNHFYCNGGTVIGLGYKSERPMASKSTQAAIRLNKVTGVLGYVRIQDANGAELATIETQAYPTMTVVYSSPALVKGATYTVLTGNSPNTLQQLTTIQAE